MHIKDFIERAKNIHQNNYDYSKSILESVKKNIIIICKLHGEFLQTPDKHLNKQGCPKCDKSCDKNLEYVIESGQKLHQNKYDYSKSIYKGMFKKIEIICPIHGSFFQTPANHINHKQNCFRCSYENKFLTQQEWIDKARKTHGNLFDYSKSIYESNRKKIEIICSKHGSFWQNAAGHLNGNKCPYCVSHISKAQEEWLDFLKIPKEKRNIVIKNDNKHFIADAFDETINTIYEFNGDYWHGNPEVYNSEYINKHNKIKFGDLYKKTINKRDELLKLGYKVISIWESDFNKIRRSKKSD